MDNNGPTQEEIAVAKEQTKELLAVMKTDASQTSGEELEKEFNKKEKFYPYFLDKKKKKVYILPYDF